MHLHVYVYTNREEYRLLPRMLLVDRRTDFTAADTMLACTLLDIRKTDLMDPFRGSRRTMSAVGHARPGSAPPLYAERVSVSVNDIR
jgi:hypothetical protein